MKVLFLSHSVDGGSFKVGSHHLARELARAGHTVAHVSTPLSILHLLAGRGGARRRNLALSSGALDDHGVFHSVPLFALPVQIHANGSGLRAHLRRIGFWDADYVLIDQPLMAGVLGKRIPGLVVYRPTDEYSYGSAARYQRAALTRVVAAIATSEHVLQELRVPSGMPTMVIENGVEFSRFGSASATKFRTGIVYVGALDHRFDWNAVVSLAISYPEQDFTLVGPVGGSLPVLPPNVSLAGPMPYGEISRLLNSAVIGLLPFNQAVENRGRSPMKFYEYLASGLYVVGTATPPLVNRHAPGTYLYADPADAVEAMRLALANSTENATGRDDARLHDWSTKVTQLMGFLTSLTRDESTVSSRS